MTQNSLYLYKLLARLKHPKGYKGKIMLVAFLGTHIPLLSLLYYFIASSSFSWELTLQVLVIALLATLGGTGLTLAALHYLLVPVHLTSLSLRQYLDHKTLPNLPTGFQDEVGTLMADTSHTIHKLDEIIHYISSYDGLTGLPNRVLLRDRLQDVIHQTQQNHQTLALLCLDLDNYQDINNALGQSVGDALLRAVAERLRTCLPPNAYLGSLGGDVFAILYPHLMASEQVRALSQVILNTLAEPFALETQTIGTSASIGISLCPLDGVQADLLLQNANTALEQAKRKGRKLYQFYSTEMNAQLQERLMLENDLRYALDRGELLLHYQPRINCQHQQMVSVEALLRWQHPTRGWISPAKFIPIAEESGLILPIGEWVLHTACAQNRAWQQAGLPPLRMAVNLSARQFEQPDLVDRISGILAEIGLAPQYLELEVTESLLMENVQQAIAILNQLHDLGIALALDDFGTGYSSLNYLRRFPLDTLKIDQSFVREVVANPDDAAVTKAIIALANSLQLNITAEGVETQEQLDYLTDQGCHEFQGYYFSRPIPASDLELLLIDSQRSPLKSAVS